MKKTMIFALLVLLAVSMFTGCHARRTHVVEHDGITRPHVTHRRDAIDMQDGFVDGPHSYGPLRRSDDAALIGDGLARNAYQPTQISRAVSQGNYSDGLKRAANPDPFLTEDMAGH